jgi:hypothetical protein
MGHVARRFVVSCDVSVVAFGNGDGPIVEPARGNHDADVRPDVAHLPSRRPEPIDADRPPGCLQ